MRMDTPDHWHLVFVVDPIERFNKFSQPVFKVNILCPMQGHQEKLTFFEAKLLHYVAFIYLGHKMVKDFFDGVTGNIDALPGNSLSNKIESAALRIWQENVALAINNPAIIFLRYPIVVATVAGFHMEDPYSHPFGGNCTHAAISVP